MADSSLSSDTGLLASSGSSADALSVADPWLSSAPVDWSIPKDLLWQLPEQYSDSVQQNPFVLPLQAQADHIDHYGHVNNGVYLDWLQQVGWAHVEQMGLSLELYRRLDRALVVHRHELDYLAPAYGDDQLVMATWVVQFNRVSVYRCFQLQRVSDGKTLFRAYSHYVCTRMSNGKACRLPPEFLAAYGRVVEEG